jgi:hypothetical protein
VLKRGKEDGDRGYESGYRAVDYPEREMKEAEVDHHGRRGRLTRGS